MITETIFECRCCDRSVRGSSNGVFFFHDDPRGTWRRILGIDGRDAICPVCVADPGCLDGLIEDGYEHACIEIFL